MDKMVIEGGRTLEGSVRLSGAKNAALPILGSTLLAQGETIIRNVPQLGDVRTMCRLLGLMGAEVDESSALKVDTSRLNSFEAPYELVKTMRASVVVLGPLVARYGRARVSLPAPAAEASARCPAPERYAST